MKKLLIATLATAAVGGAFADPLVYQYKASIKQMNLKVKKVTYNKAKIEAYVKFQSTASLKGYLIQDTDGATSASIQALVGSGNSVPATRPVDYGRNTAFLVVMNSKAEKEVRAPKILPAVLDTKWIDESFTAKKTGLAEGYLYVGGDVVATPQREALDIYNGVLSVRTGTATPAKGFISDYVWTSLWLFGQYNGPFFDVAESMRVANAQIAIDQAQPADLQTGFDPLTPAPPPAAEYYFHDAWMNGSGFGKWVSGKLTKPCCGVTAGAMGPMYAAENASKVLDSLTGSVKGGIFLCTENGIVEGTAGAGIANLVWEDQFFVQRWDKNAANPGQWLTAGDLDQTDLWQDGDLELNTTDVITGTWSIKYTTALKPVTVTAAELAALTAVGPTEDAKGLAVLMNTIKGAAVALDKNVLFADGNEIWNVANPYHSGQLPLITPQFCKYYGLLNYK